MTEEQQLAQIRDRIDDLDRQMQDLLNARAQAAREVAEIKLASGEDAVFYRPEREAMVLRMVKERNAGPLGAEAMARLFREIMSECLALELPLKIGYLGPEGTFTQAAALKHFGHAVTTVPMAAISDVFQEVESGGCHYGVVPVENSSEGVVSHTLDMFLNSPLKICGEVTLRIHHNLMGRDADLGNLQVIYSHQQSLAQCRGWLDRHLPLVERTPVGSNAEAAQRAAKAAYSAAIASATAAELYGLQVLAPNIEDEAGNTTRFLVVGEQAVPASGHDKTSLLLSTRNEAGGLYRLLAPLAEHDISMTRIESRPSRRGHWDYVFFVDINGHREDPEVANALAVLKQQAGMFKELGSYPKAVM